MVSEVGTTQWPKYEFGDDCGRYVDEDEVTLNKGSENTVDNSDRLKIPAVRGLFTPKEPKTEPSKTPLKKPQNMKTRKSYPSKAAYFIANKYPKYSFGRGGEPLSQP